MGYRSEVAYKIKFDKAEIKPVEPWPFPVKKPKRKPAAKKIVAKKATSVAKKKTATKKR